MISMRQSLYVEVSEGAAGQRLLRLNNQAWMKNEPLLRLREIPAHMSLVSIVQYISVELKLNKKNEAGLKDRYDRKDDYKYRGHDDQRHQDGQHREDRQHRQIFGDGELTNEDHNDIDIDINNDQQAEYNVFAFIAENTKSFGNNRSKLGRKPPREGKLPRRVGDLALSSNEYMKKYKGCWVCHGKGNAHQHDHAKRAVYAVNKKEYFKLHPERVPREKRMQNLKDRQICQEGGGRGKDRHLCQIGDVANSLWQAGRELQELQEQSLRHGDLGPLSRARLSKNRPGGAPQKSVRDPEENPGN